MDGRTGIWRAAFVALRIVSVYLVVHALIVAAQFSPFLVTGGSNAARWAIIIAIILLLAAGAELWLAADGIANRIADFAEDLEGDQEQDTEGTVPASPQPPSWIDATSVLSIGLTILGIVFAVDALSAAIVTIGQIIQTQGSNAPGFSTPHTTDFFRLATDLLVIAIGVGLVLGAQNIARALRRLRAPPTEPTEPEP